MKNSELRKLNEKLAMTLQFDLTRFYDVIVRNSVFELGFLTREFQIPDVDQENLNYSLET